MVTKVGEHVITVEGDLVRVTHKGDIDLAIVTEFLATIDPVATRYEHWDVFVDIRELGAVSPEARKYAGVWAKRRTNYRATFYGASAITRVVMTLMSRGAEIFTGKPRTLRFFKTAEEAWTWLQEQRRLERQAK